MAKRGPKTTTIHDRAWALLDLLSPVEGRERAELQRELGCSRRGFRYALARARRMIAPEQITITCVLSRWGPRGNPVISYQYHLSCTQWSLRRLRQRQGVVGCKT